MSRTLGAVFMLAAYCSAQGFDPKPPLPSPTVDEALQAKLAALVKDFRGDVGVYVRHLPTGRGASIRADELFPTASLIKVPILLGIYDKIDKKELDEGAKLVYEEKRKYAGEDLLGSFKDGEKIALTKLCFLMIAFSDNTASLWLQELAGTGTAINAWLDAHGFGSTRVNSRTPGREKDREAYGWGQTTPREMAELLVGIREGRFGAKSSCERMHRFLCKTYWDEEAVSSIPPSVQVASKQGAVNRSRSEVLLVHAPKGDYVFSVITKNQEDQSWEKSNAGYVLLRDVSTLLWNHFEGAAPVGR